MGDDELDPDFRGPAPGREPWERDTPPIRDPRDLFGSQAGSLAQLAAVRIRPRTGPYAQGLLMYELGQRTARETAARQVVAPASWLGEIPKAPWARRAKLGKGGRLYTLADIQRNVVRNNQAVNRAKEKASIEANRKAQVADRLSRDVLRRAGTSTGSVAADALAIVGQEANVLLFERKRERTARLNRLRVGRRGAAATRAFQPTGIPGRTGAKSTRPLDKPGPLSTGIPSGKSTGTERAARSATKLPTGRNSVGLPRPEGSIESEASKKARGVMGSSKQLPGTRSVLSIPQRIASRFSVAIRSMLPINLARPIGLRAARTGLTGRDIRSAPQLSLTPVNSVGVGSLLQSSSCSCPKETKPQKRRREKGCTNPLISRTERDGIITIKREAKCPPSKPK